MGTKVLTLTLSLILLLLLDACSGDRQSSLPDESISTPPAVELQAMLLDELERLGIDPGRQPFSAPDGHSNAVFNLAATVNDPDGPGPMPPDSVEFRWVECNTGDYNQDGLVGIADLTPLAAAWQRSVAYDDPLLHGGFDSWPSGNYLDDGGVAPGEVPLTGSPAENWRLARVDGNADGLVNISDVTPIAQNWQHWLDGYRVYRRMPGETEFTMLPDPADPLAPLSVERPDMALLPQHPVGYSFTDDELGPASGIYEYYIVACDVEANDEGEPCSIVSIDLDSGGGGNLPPTAHLVATPDNGTAPLIIELDARGSSDPDGTLVQFEYDPEGDGSWMAPTTIPVINFTYQWAGSYTAKVRVTDDQGATDIASATVTLDGLPQQHDPVASLVANPDNGAAPLNVTLDASASTDADGDIAAFLWDLDGDGTYTTFGGLDPTYSHTFTEVGTWTVGVQVKDSLNHTDEATVQVTVTPGSAFWHVYDADAVTGGTKAEPSLSEVDGLPAIAYWNGTAGDIVYLRATDSQGTAWGTPFAIATTTGSQGGKPSLAIIGGRPAVSYYWSVNAYHGYIVYKRADDATGSIWPGETMVAGVDYSIKSWANCLSEINGRPAIAFREMIGGDLRYVRASDSAGDAWPDSVIAMAGDNAGFHVELRQVEGRPAISQIQQTNSATVWYQRSADVNGADWTGVGSIAEGFLGNGYGGQECSMAIINGNPAICFYDKNGQDLRFVRASDAAGSSWGTELTLDDRPKAGRYCRMAEAGGRAYIVYFLESATELYAIQAADADATLWLPPEKIADTIMAYMDAGEIDGRPAAAYTSGNVVKFAVKY